MRRLRILKGIVRNASALTLILLLGVSVSAAPTEIVVPNNLVSTAGNAQGLDPFSLGGSNPHLTSTRYQQVYDVSQFAAILPGGATITKIAFRVPAGGVAFSSTIPNAQINLSTTARKPDGLSNTFQDNVGADDTVVFTGPLSLSSAATGSPTRDFDIVVTLSVPFKYDPAKGNLLLEVRNPGGGPKARFDAENTFGDSISAVLSKDVNSPQANEPNVGSAGLVTKFILESCIGGTPAPGEVIATPKSGTQIDVSWKVPTVGCAGLQGYKLYRDGVAVGQTGVGVNSYSDTVPKGCTEYHYTVSTLDNGNNESSQSQPAVPVTSLDSAPLAPSGLKATLNGTSEIDLNWDPAANTGCAVAGYNVYAKLSLKLPGKPSIVLWKKIGTPSGTSFALTGLNIKPGYSACFAVSAHTAAGSQSAFSTEACINLPDLGKLLDDLKHEAWQKVLTGQGCGTVITLGPHGPKIGPVGPGDPFGQVSEPGPSLSSLSPAERDAVISVMFAGLAGEMKDARTQKQLRDLSVRFANEGLQNLKTGETHK